MTGLLSTCGLQFQDWSAPYRLFSQDRLDTENLFTGVRRAVLNSLPDQAPLCLALDDSVFRKAGAKIHGVAWRRDPLSPPFQVNLIRAQRFLQFSAAVPVAEHAQAIRMVPVDFLHSPTPPKPGRNASALELKLYGEARRQASLGRQAVARLEAIQDSLPPLGGGAARPVRLLVDGGYTNQTVLKHLPPHTTLIGRIRKDAKLYYPAATPPGRRGRRRRYGELAWTPEQLRQDNAVAWETVTLFAAGAEHLCRVKTVTGLLWRTAGLGQPLKLVVIAPLHYRPRQRSRLLYRRPAYLICTDPTLDTQQIVQNYVWRWEIEVNFEEEKSLLGVGQAQVRKPAATQAVPALLIAAYAVLLLAAIGRGVGSPAASLLPPPKWSARRSPIRTSTQRLIHELRAEVWGRGLGLRQGNFSGFMTPQPLNQKPEKILPSLPDALLYCNG